MIKTQLAAPRINSEELPLPILFKTEVYEPGARCGLHRHPWGELNYAASGVMELKISGKGFLSPRHYLVWTPPDTEHDGRNSFKTRYTSIYIERRLCKLLPDKPCTLVLSPLLKAIIDHFETRKIRHPITSEDLRLADVLIDQLRLAPKHASYLPLSNHPKIKPIIAEMLKTPNDDRTLSEWGKFIHATERTLARYFQSEFGISFGEWRQRLKTVTAITRLTEGESVQNIALDLGYNTPSAFIAMFRRMTGTTPSTYAKPYPKCLDENY